MGNMMLWITLAIYAICIVVFTATPYLTRRTELFGVSLPSSEIDRPELSAMRRAYAGLSLLAGAALVALTVIFFALFQSEAAQIRIMLILLFSYLAAEFPIYLVFHRRMKAFKAAQPWRAHGASVEAAKATANGLAPGGDINPGAGKRCDEDCIGAEYSAGVENGAGADDGIDAIDEENAGETAFAEPVLIVDTAPPAREVIHPLWLLLFAVTGAAALVYLWQVWPALPDRIPIHWNAGGIVNGWTDKSPGGVVTILLAQWILIAAFMLAYFMIPATKRQIDAADPVRSREQGRRFRHIMSACMVFGGAALTLVLGILPVAMAQSGGEPAYITVAMIIIFAILAAIIIAIFYAGQGGSKLKTKSGASEASEAMKAQKRQANTDDDHYWILGQFYLNRKDPAVFVEKRFGIGWTFNLARPVTWALFGVFAAITIVSLVLAFSVG